VANSDDSHGADFLALPIAEKIPFSLSDVSDINLTTEGSTFTLFDTKMHTRLIGQFNIYNIIACAHMARAFGVSPADIARGVAGLTEIKGRGEKITLEHDTEHKQDFTVIVDYAHTPSSLEAIYSAFDHERKICVLGNTGGGRDTWKRPEMAKIADTHCSRIILTNEDPYDEDPLSIVEHMATGISISPYEIILDRKEAIDKAINYAEPHDVVIITGKGTDPYIMGPNGTKEIWSDQDVAKDAIARKLSL
jgi:UDP-N-acetylmuramoyl-L-alanyl-D-glutamate--2,6-diaminopimelate ligase